MKTTLKKLEDRVERAVERLSAVTRERDRMREELEGRAANGPRDRQADWPARIAEIERGLRDAARDLRGE